MLLKTPRRELARKNARSQPERPHHPAPCSHLPVVEDAPQLLVGVSQEPVWRGGPGPVRHHQWREVPFQAHQELLYLK